jgi:hypothetical protein
MWLQLAEVVTTQEYYLFYWNLVWGISQIRLRRYPLAETLSF